MGAGGYIGEKPWGQQKQSVDGQALSGRIDLVAKVSSVTLPGREGNFHPVKLGDMPGDVDKPGTWHLEPGVKFAVSSECDGDKRQSVFDRFCRQGQVLLQGEHVGEGHSHLHNVSNYPEEKRVAKSFDSWTKEKKQQTFDTHWDSYKFV